MRMGAFNVLLAVPLCLSVVRIGAVPIIQSRNTQSKQPVSTLSQAETDPFVRPARFSQVAYCSSQSVMSWNCGAPCDALPGVEAIVTGGDDGLIPMYFIAHDPQAQSIVVAHQGTDPSNILSIANDVQIALEPLDPTLFPNSDPKVKTHDGFAKTFARTADQILGNVTAALKDKGVNKVDIQGHSLGAAVAAMDAVFLRQNLDPSVTITTTVFGLPRSGNQDWANFVDQTVPGLVHVHNRNDPVGRVPGTFLGYQHFSGEIHIKSDGSAVNCPGQENQDSTCIDGISTLQLLNVVQGKNDHLGPYFDNISMGAQACTA